MNAFEAVKEAIPLPQYASELTELRRSGGTLVGRCLLPDHEDRTPSFTVWPGNDSWWCFGACARGGDVIDLCQAIEGGEPWEAMMTLATRYGIRLRERPHSWLDWQDEKGQRRKTLVETIAQSYRRRLFRFFKEDLQSMSDPIEREEEARALWKNLWLLAWRCAHGRVNS